jgi:hypothetical protein
VAVCAVILFEIYVEIGGPGDGYSARKAQKLTSVANTLVANGRS